MVYAAVLAAGLATAEGPALGQTVIVGENAKPGTAAWLLGNPAADHEIEGYASVTSVNRGEAFSIFVSTAATAYIVDIFRLGWYGGTGARHVSGPVVRESVRQPPPVADHATGLVECDWRDPYVVTTRTDDESEWRSGIYLIKLTALGTGKQSYIPFVVREDDRPSAMLFQASVITYQAYNNWGGRSLYGFNSRDDRPALKVSFNRPYAASDHPRAISGVGAGDLLTTLAIPARDPAPPAGWEYNLVRWLEREGYDVTYSTNIDTHEDPRLLMRHRVWLSVGHDEYWSWPMRRHVEDALAAGVSLAFFSANTCYWQVRLEPSPTTGQPNRVIVSYKDEARTRDPFALDDDPANDRQISTRWREPPVNRPEEELIGVMYDGNPAEADLVIAAGHHWILQSTGLHAGDRLPGLLGYEADRQFGRAPAETVILAASPYEWEKTTHWAQMAVYEVPNGATVFAAGTIQWSWGLDDFNAPGVRSARRSAAAEQMTRNILGRMSRAPAAATAPH